MRTSLQHSFIFLISGHSLKCLAVPLPRLRGQCVKALAMPYIINCCWRVPVWRDEGIAPRACRPASASYSAYRGISLADQDVYHRLSHLSLSTYAYTHEHVHARTHVHPFTLRLER